MTLDSASASVSENTTAPADAMAAQVEDGMSPLQVAAGSSVECTFTVAGQELRAELGTSINDEFQAVALFAARVQGLDESFNGNPEEVGAFLDDATEPGDAATTPNGTAVLRSLEVRGEGTAALLMSSQDLGAGDLEDVADALAEALQA